MKPIHLNLASKPYRDDRPFYVGAAALLLLTILLSVVNIKTALEYFENTRNTRAEIARLEQSIAAERQKASSIEAQTRSIDLKQLSKQTAFINAQIAERSFSWSSLLSELERVVPSDVRLESLNPTVDKSGVTRLDLVCVSKSPDGMIKLLRGLLASEKFSGAFPQGEQGRDGLYQFRIRVDYIGNSRGVIQ